MRDADSMSEFRTLFPENQWRSTSADYYEWKILQNPFHQGKIYLERDHDLVTGSITLTPRKISISGETFDAAELGDAFTHPDRRRQGIFSRGVNSCTEFALSNGLGVIYGTPTAEALVIYEKALGYYACPFINVSSLAKITPNLRSVIRYLAKMILRRKMNPLEKRVDILNI